MSEDVKYPEEIRMEAIERQLKGYNNGEYMCEWIKRGGLIRPRCHTCMEGKQEEARASLGVR
jgi:hypothetical protein